LDLAGNHFTGEVQALPVPVPEYCNFTQRQGAVFICPLPAGFRQCLWSVPACIGSPTTRFSLNTTLTNVSIDRPRFESQTAEFAAALQAAWNSATADAADVQEPVKNMTVTGYEPMMGATAVDSGAVISLAVEADEAPEVIDVLWQSLNDSAVSELSFKRAFVDVTTEGDYGFANVTEAGIAVHQGCPRCYECYGGTAVLYGETHCGAEQSPQRGFCRWDQSNPQCLTDGGHDGTSACNMCMCNPGYGPQDSGCPVKEGRLPVVPATLQDVFEVVGYITAALGFLTAVYNARKICIERYKRRHGGDVDDDVELDWRDNIAVYVCCGAPAVTEDAEGAAGAENEAEQQRGTRTRRGGADDPLLPNDSLEHDRRFLDTQQSASVRASGGPKGIIGRGIEIDGRVGVVTGVVVKLGGSTLHTIEFNSGEAETMLLAKRKGGKGATFHLAHDELFCSPGSFHDAATPEREKSRQAQRVRATSPVTGVGQREKGKQDPNGSDLANQSR
jgi:hypothetical protein